MSTQKIKSGVTYVVSRPIERTLKLSAEVTPKGLKIRADAGGPDSNNQIIADMKLVEGRLVIEPVTVFCDDLIALLGSNKLSLA